MSADFHRSKSIYKNHFLELELLAGNAAILTATQDYIPKEEFKEFFNEIGDLISANNIKAIVFDKRKLEVFHQQSMEWYYVNWKPKMLKKGLDTYFKLIPNYPWFNEEIVDNSQKLIFEKYPDLDFSEIKNIYLNSMEEALREIKKL